MHPCVHVYYSVQYYVIHTCATLVFLLNLHCELNGKVACGPGTGVDSLSHVARGQMCHQRISTRHLVSLWSVGWLRTEYILPYARRLNLVPNGLRINTKSKSKKAQRIMETTQQRLVTAHVDDLHQKQRKLSLQQGQITAALQDTLSTEDSRDNCPDTHREAHNKDVYNRTKGRNPEEVRQAPIRPHEAHAHAHDTTA